ncbi:SDR family oxidoreductase [Bacteroides faecis]|nr:SDR family oxidoreductase [Bacteroides faecis]
MDITDNIKVDSEIRKINESFGKIDILVNAAAMFMDGSLSEAIDEYRKIMEINVIAQYGILKTITNIMKKAGKWIYI